MAPITVRCKACQHTMKFSAEKAGKKAKCSKCGTLAVIQAEEEPIALVDAPPPLETAPPAAPPSELTAQEPAEKPFDEFADDGPSSYGVWVDPELEKIAKQREQEEKDQAKKKKDKKALPKVARKIKPIPDAESWDKVRLGLYFFFLGSCLWMAAHLLQGIYVLIGSVDVSEYANLIAGNLQVRMGEELPPRGQFWDMDEYNIYMGLIAGRDFAGFAKVCLTLSTVLHLLQTGCFLVGYFCCMSVPRRFGMFGQVLTMMGLGAFNTLILLSLKLLPILGAFNYIMIPYVVPEIAMTEYNIERVVPINVLWSGSPFWENFLCLIFKFLYYLEPTIACVFVWSAGVAIKDEEVEKGGHGRAQLCLGTLFVLIGFHLLSLCGASPMLVQLLRIFYTLWFFFLVMFLLQYMMLLLKTRDVLYDKINPKNELDEDEEDKPKAKPAKEKEGKKKSKAAR